MYEFTAYPWETGSDSATFRLFDGEDYSNLAAILLSIDNDAPVAADRGVFPVRHGQTLVGINPLAGSVDGNGDALTISIEQYPTKGNLGYNDVTGTYEFFAHPWETGADSIVYRLHDGAEYSNYATISIMIENTAPVAADQGVFNVDHGQTLTGINPLAGSHDDEADALTISIEQSPTKGTLAYNDVTGTYEFTAYTWETGADSIVYRLHDGAEYSNFATISIMIGNTAPVAADQGVFNIMQGFSVQGIDLLAGSFDNETDTLTVNIDEYPSKGTLSYDDTTGTYKFTAYSWETGPDSIVFRLHDGAEYSLQATISLYIDPQPYHVYLQAVANANTLFENDVLSAVGIRDVEINDIRADVQTDALTAFGDYEVAFDGYFDDYHANETLARAAYVSVVTDANGILIPILDTAESALHSGLQDAFDTYTALLDNALQTYLNALAVLDSAYSDATAPYQADYDQALDAYLVDPANPDLQAALDAADTALGTATASAADVWQGGYDSLKATYDIQRDAYNAAYQNVRQTLIDAYVAEVSDARQGWDDAEQAAWPGFQAEEAQQWNSFLGSETSEWNALIGRVSQIVSASAASETNTESQFNGRRSQATTAWQQREQTAWNTYLNATSSIPELPIGDRIDVPPDIPVPATEPAPGVTMLDDDQVIQVAADGVDIRMRQNEMSNIARRTGNQWWNQRNPAAQIRNPTPVDWTRVGGAARIVGGALEVFVGLTTSWVGGALVAVHGGDNILAGVVTLWTGQYQAGATEQAISQTLTLLGASQDDANQTAALLDATLTVGGTLRASQNLRIVAVRTRTAPAITGQGMTNPEIMRAFFTGQALASTPANIAALRWYLQVARDTLERYQRTGYQGPGVATQTQRIQDILDQLTRWGVGE